MAIVPSKGAAGAGTISITHRDRDRLSALVEGYRLQGREDRGTLQRLGEEILFTLVLPSRSDVDAGRISVMDQPESAVRNAGTSAAGGAQRPPG